MIHRDMSMSEFLKETYPYPLIIFGNKSRKEISNWCSDNGVSHYDIQYGGMWGNQNCWKLRFAESGDQMLAMLAFK